MESKSPNRILHQLPHGGLMIIENGQIIMEFRHDESQMAGMHILPPRIYHKLLFG